MAKERITPEYTVKCGGIQLAIWANETTKGTFQSITIDKSYKDDTGWKRTKSFKPADLVKIKLGINEILRYLYVRGDTPTERITSERITSKSDNDNRNNDSDNQTDTTPF